MDIQGCKHFGSTDGFTHSLQGKNVYKDQCSKCFAQPKSETGIYVCLRCFNSFCKQTHLDEHRQKFNHHIYLQIQMIELPAPEQGYEITKVAIGKQGGAFGGPEYKSVYHVYCAQCNVHVEDFKILSPQLEGIVNSIISTESAYKKQTLVTWELELQPCQHTLTLQQNPQHFDLSKCGQCALSNALWLCLTCGHIGCARRNFDGTGGNGHGIQHYKDTKHPLVVKSGTITPEGAASVYCYQCDDDITDNYLSQHLKVLGVNIAEQRKTEKTIQQLVLDLNLNMSLSRIIEEGKKMNHMYGKGFTGIDNIGNSCYMNSVVQLLFSLSQFTDQYYQRGVEHMNNCNRLPSECFYCQFSKIGDGLYSGKYSEKKQRTNIINEKPVYEEYQLAIKPYDFKMLLAAKNNEFMSNRQQDAQQYLQWVLERLVKQQKNYNLKNTTSLFDYVAVNKLVCYGCNGYKLVENKTNEFKFPVPLPTPEQIQQYYQKLAQEHNSAVKQSKKQEDPQYETTFAKCLELLKNGELVEANCSKCKKPSNFKSLWLLKSTPKYLISISNRFVLENWVPKKLNALIHMGDQRLDLNSFLVVNNHEGEFNIEVSKEEKKQYCQDNVNALMEMGFSQNAAIRALIANKNNVQVACGWIYDHIDDADLNEPVKKKTSNPNEPPKQLISQVADLGFTNIQATVALIKYKNNVDQAINHLFDTGGDVSDLMSLLQPPEKKKEESVEVKYTNYQLHGVVVHLGKSVHSGHYVVYIKKNNKWILYNDSKVYETEEPVLQKGFIYLWKGVQ